MSTAELLIEGKTRFSIANIELIFRS